ncbi:SMP-30/gluconolactonase/LRE family protein [Larsenimonas suaedae]|uniref:SMP-30/gluconolactonase/LRE family protein n=1 Tax=Larsenimonas suaedae TaxID=1851019 RepID=A0ABU1GSK1_9GAMM|nr:SMP-30/gluconolactonase/LRE family protein [Larsenimonas suaedae]MCM2972213.1 SMP-30/gluconolactonase/LRE family protein [Larsenimonas suaedae]MDR5894991.1 SMP-30/gluconolactonase/LRE family protein [Larsenimonas suaedae]
MDQSSSKDGATRRGFVKQAMALSAGAVTMSYLGRASAEPLGLRYPDAAVEVLDDSFLKYRLFNASVEKLATGMRWAEGPVWVADGRYLLVSDIPNNRIMRWDEITGAFSPYRQPSNFSNGMCRDLQGRLIVCEGSTTDGLGRRVTRTEHNGKITVLADQYQGKRFNSPNDVVVRSDGSIWFTDPPFQTGNDYEGHRIDTELPHGVYRIDGESGEVRQVIKDVAGPNGLCFSPDETTLYLVEGRAKPNRLVWAYSVNDDGTLGARRQHIKAEGYGALDGIKCDEDGNLWCGWGSSGDPRGRPEDLDGVMVFNPEGKAIGHIRLPERCANLCFGGREGNRVFMAGSHSVYALYVNTRSALN